MVGLEPPEGEGMDGEGSPMDMEQDKSYMQPAESPGAALEMVRQLMGSEDARSPEEQMQAGYNKSRPGMSAAKVFGG